MSGITTLIIVGAVMFSVLGGITLLAYVYSLNNIKSKTVGDGQHGTARWMTKGEQRRAYQHIPFTPKKWREQAENGKTPTGEDGKVLPQGIVVGCTGNTTAMVDTGDVHVLMIGAAGVGKTAFWLYPCIEYACASGMSFLSTDTKGDVMRNYGNIAKGYRRQLVRGKAYWMCSGRASGATICSSQRMSESDVYEAFNRMLFKLKEHHHAILGALIRDIEVMQSKTSENHEKIVEIDKEIADLAARNLVIVRLHTSGILNGSDYAAQSSEINNKISALRSERKRKLAEDEGNEQLDKLKELQGILDEYEPTKAFDEDLFHQIIEKAVVMSKSEIAFHLIGGLKLTETIA